MTIRCKAVHENGVLRPEKPLELADGAQVELIVVPDRKSDAAPLVGWDAREAAEAMARIAALPEEGSGDPFDSRDHDKVLYGDSGAR